ncbi:MAG TPA: Rieske 2Fe-2S domain-containing protein, partial [Stellaceae bacterium]|nr:Rieske 2Fe-2S domain-containing protein [Stellaceae bacterium]
MTTTAESELLTRVGPGTPMGALMREYWIPAALSAELKADGDPMRLKLLGEELIAFRDSSGRVGVMDHRCPHRCASLFYGRNEENGIRCIYHGWKYDVDGNCLDQPNLPPHQVHKDKIKAKAYRASERNGVIWVYMGARDKAPPLPMFEATLMPPDEVRIGVVQRECNYLQALEGDIDTSHFAFLHAGALDWKELMPGSTWYYSMKDRAPEYSIENTDWGTMYGAHRPAETGTTYWRVAHFLFPFWTIPPDGDFSTHVVARAWVPLDDTHCMFFIWSWLGATPKERLLKTGEPIPGVNFGQQGLLPNTTDWLGRFRLNANATNDYKIDRAAQRGGHNFSGLHNITLEDQCMTESMGPVVDHSLEHLAPSDAMIGVTRRRLLQAVRDFT